MKYLFFLILALNLQADLTDLENPKIVDFEKKLGFHYFVENPEPVIENYLRALSVFESLGKNHPSLEASMVPYLVKAYESIANQRNWHFNLSEAAKLEYEIICGNAKGENIADKQIGTLSSYLSFKVICD